MPAGFDMNFHDLEMPCEWSDRECWEAAADDLAKEMGFEWPEGMELPDCSEGDMECIFAGAAELLEAWDITIPGLP